MAILTFVIGLIIGVAAMCVLSVTSDVYDEKTDTAEWYDRGSLSCRCSRCGNKSLKESRFCPNCGAKMETKI